MSWTCFRQEGPQCARLSDLKSALNLGVARHVSKAAQQSSPESLVRAGIQAGMRLQKSAKAGLTDNQQWFNDTI
jgi:hypothetical protein